MTSRPTPPPIAPERESAGASPARLQVAADPDFMLSLARGLAVIRAFDLGERALSIAEISRLTTLPRSSVRRCLRTLQTLGYATSRDGLYELTPAVLRLGHAYLGSVGISRAAQPILERVSDALHESSSLAVLDGDEVVYIARAATRRIMSIGLEVGSRLPAACTSMGRVLLAFADDATRSRLLSRVKLVRHTVHTITEKKALHDELDRIRSQGYAVVNQELELGLCSMAVPVYRHDGVVVAAINVGAHAARAETETRECQFLPVLRAAAADISAAIGTALR